MRLSNPILLYGSIILLAVGLTVVSLGFIRPADCQSFCDAPDQALCPSGTCVPGAQRAGLPLPVVVDDPGGGSPTGGWGKLGQEDLPNPLTFGLDVLFYSALLWLAWYAVQVVRGAAWREELLAVALSLAVVLVCLLLGLYLYWPFLNR